MTSKSALEQLYEFALSSEPMELIIKDFKDIILKDLEVLEILKPMLEIKKGSTWEYLDVKHCFFDTQEQIDKVKECLENEK